MDCVRRRGKCIQCRGNSRSVRKTPYLAKLEDKELRYQYSELMLNLMDRSQSLSASFRRAPPKDLALILLQIQDFNAMVP